jgi:segregation and condensation protein B
VEAFEIESVIESILFASGEPVPTERIAAVLGVSDFDVESAANRLRDKYSFEKRGIRLVKMDNTLQLCSSPENADYIRLTLETRKPPQLSQQALEVLAIVAYFQPVTRAYIEQIRGVDSSYTISLLLDRGIIESAGRLAVPGRPILYKTTTVFLRTFGIESLHDLPELPEVQSNDDGREGIQNAILTLRSIETGDSNLSEDIDNTDCECEKDT